HLVGQLGDVFARVAALGHGQAVQAVVDRLREDVHLVAGVVDVVLAGDVGAAGLEHAGDRIAQGGPTGVPDVQRPGGVRGDEFHVHHVAGERVVGAVGRAGLDDGLGQFAGGGGVDGDVQEAGAGDVHGGDPGDRHEASAQHGGELAGVHPG